MKSVWSLFLFFTFCFNLYSQSGTASPNQKSSEEEAVRQAVHALVAAFDHNDVDAIDRLSTADYIFVNPAGKVLSKAQYLELIRSGTLKVESYNVDEEIIRLYGDTAVVIYRSTPKGTFKGTELTSQRRVTTVFIKQNGQWLTTGRQSTPILQPK